MRTSFSYSSILGAVLLAAACGTAQAAQDCSALRGCAAKFCYIENEISVAQAQKNVHREAGLQKALSEAKASCTDESLQQQRRADVADKEQKLKARQAELEEAQRKGKTDKIHKAQRKLDDAQEELKRAQAELAR